MNTPAPTKTETEKTSLQHYTWELGPYTIRTKKQRTKDHNL